MQANDAQFPLFHQSQLALLRNLILFSLKSNPTHAINPILEGGEPPFISFTTQWNWILLKLTSRILRKQTNP